jgi:hypothetical protein
MRQIRAAEAVALISKLYKFYALLRMHDKPTLQA